MCVSRNSSEGLAAQACVVGRYSLDGGGGRRCVLPRLEGVLKYVWIGGERE